MPGWAIWGLAHLILAAVGTWAARRYALRRSLLDQPGARRSHCVPTPRGGGVGIVAAVLAGTLWLMGQGDADVPAVLPAFALGLGLVAVIGWVDDHRPLSPGWRLCVQAAAGLVLGAGLYLDTGSSMWLVVALGVTLVLVNVWNFMDGIDGLATSQAVVVAVVFASLLAGPGAWLAGGVAAAALGFLPFNFPRARIFLGDVGSGALGFALAGLACMAFAQAPSQWPWLLLPLSAFLVDAGFTLGVRMLRGERWWLPHTQHLYQCLARCDRRHWRVTIAYLVFSIVAVTLPAWAAGASWHLAVLCCLAWYSSASILWWVLRKGVRDVESSEAE